MHCGREELSAGTVWEEAMLVFVRLRWKLRRRNERVEQKG